MKDLFWITEGRDDTTSEIIETNYIAVRREQPRELIMTRDGAKFNQLAKIDVVRA